MSDEIITASSAGVLTGKLLQFASGAIYDEGRNIINIHDYKLDVLEEIQVDKHNKNLWLFIGINIDKYNILKRFPKARVLHNIQDLRDWKCGKIEMGLLHPTTCRSRFKITAWRKYCYLV